MGAKPESEKEDGKNFIDRNAEWDSPSEEREERKRGM